jgi:hypothetical protein
MARQGSCSRHLLALPAGGQTTGSFSRKSIDWRGAPRRRRLVQKGRMRRARPGADENSLRAARFAIRQETRLKILIKFAICKKAEIRFVTAIVETLAM